MNQFDSSREMLMRGMGMDAMQTSSAFVMPKAPEGPGIRNFRSSQDPNDPANISREGLEEAVRSSLQRKGFSDNMIAELSASGVVTKAIDDVLTKFKQENTPYILLADKSALEIKMFQPKQKNLRKVTIYDNGLAPQAVWAVLSDKAIKAMKRPMPVSRPQEIAYLRGNTGHLPFNSEGLIVPIMIDQMGNAITDIRWWDWSDESLRFFNKEKEN